MQSLPPALLLMALLITTGCTGPTPQTVSSDAEVSGETVMDPSKDSRWLIVPGKRIGEITANSSEADLIRLYGQENVAADDIYVGEGLSEPGTVVFPDAPEKRLEILWADPEQRQKPDVILIRGETTVWHTGEGITLGTPVSKLELANGGAFSLYGFSWDYGGTITHWQGGRLADALRKESGALMLRLSEGAALDVATEDELMSITGDREIPSDHPVVQKIDPVVNEMALRFFRPETQAPDPNDPNYD